jgi:hypothetical protein
MTVIYRIHKNILFYSESDISLGELEVIKNADLNQANFFYSESDISLGKLEVIKNADLNQANSAGENLAYTDFLAGTYLKGADLKCAYLKGADLKYAIDYDCFKPIRGRLSWLKKRLMRLKKQKWL